MKDSASPTHILADFVVNTVYDDLPANAVDIARMSITDGIGTCIAGAGSDTGNIIIGYVGEGACAPEATVVAGGFKTRATDAALAMDWRIPGAAFRSASSSVFRTQPSPTMR